MAKKLSEINLNLLNVLNILLKEKNITAAAKKLNLTQPTISYSLKQLRDIFDDELLYKSKNSNKMYLTPLGKSLIEPVNEIILKLEKIFKLKDFDPATSKREFRIAATDYALNAIVSDLIKNIHKEAPFITFYISGIKYSRIKKQLENDEVDIAIGAFEPEKENKGFIYQYLMAIEPVCWADKNHPIFKNKDFSIENYLKYPHLIIRHPKFGHIVSKENETIKQFSDTENIPNISIHNSMEAISFLTGTNFICIGGKSTAQKYMDFYGLSYRHLPFKTQNYIIYACRHIDKSNDKAILWLISKIEDITSNIIE